MIVNADRYLELLTLTIIVIHDVSWGSKKQVSVALSTCEAEIMAASGIRGG